jgi:ribosome-associated protein
MATTKTTPKAAPIKKTVTKPATTATKPAHKSAVKPASKASKKPAEEFMPVPKAPYSPPRVVMDKKDVQKLQRVIVDALEDVKAVDIQVFDTEEQTALFERVMVASGTSNRQTRALAASVRDAVRDAGFDKPRIEGEDNGEWIIVDCHAIVVHLMQPAIRQYYHLEDLWGDKPVRMKFGAPKPVAVVKEVKEKKPKTDKKAADKNAAAKKPAAKKVATKSAPASAGKPRGFSGRPPAKKLAAKKVAAKKSVPAKTVAAKKAPAKKVAAKKA